MSIYTFAYNKKKPLRKCFLKYNNTDKRITKEEYLPNLSHAFGNLDVSRVSHVSQTVLSYIENNIIGFSLKLMAIFA